MSNIINLRKRDRLNRRNIEAEARAWLVRFDADEPPDHETLSQFRSWLNATDLHRQVFQEVAAIWKDLDRWSEFLDTNATRTGVRADIKVAQASRRWPSMRFAGAAALLALILVSGLIVNRWLSGAPGTANVAQEYTASIGQVRHVALRDGSSIQLDTRSNVTVAFDDSFRIVHLNEGEAFFSVSHDSKKPFIVYAGKYAVKAVGTAFSVRIQGNNHLDLTVTDGRVQVASLKAPIADGHIDDLTRMKDVTSLVRVTAGQKLTLNDEEETVQRVELARMEKELSWRDGMLIFDNDPLEEVVSQINRYTEVRIVISDPSIRQLKFGGYFKIGDVPAILATMNQNFGLRVEKVGDGVIYLSRR